MKHLITDMLDIEFPILQGAMAHISDGRFAAAVSNAGGLGIIYSAGRDPALIREDIRICRQLTNRPFGVNAVMQPPKMIPSLVDLLVSEKVPVITTSAGNPTPWIPKLKEGGAKVISVVATPKQAQKAEAAGADAIIAEGEESGGHIGSTTTMTLVPAISDVVRIPVIAAGGIADGRGMAAAIMLGASAVQCGTVFMASQECPVSDRFKQALLASAVSDTIVTGRICHDVVRCLKSPLSEKMQEMELSGCSPEELMTLGTGSLRKAVLGNWEDGSFQAGQSAGLLTEIRTCRQIMEHMMEEMYTVIRKEALQS